MYHKIASSLKYRSQFYNGSASIKLFLTIDFYFILFHFLDFRYVLEIYSCSPCENVWLYLVYVVQEYTPIFLGGGWNICTDCKSLRYVCKTYIHVLPYIGTRSLTYMYISIPKPIHLNRARLSMQKPVKLTKKDILYYYLPLEAYILILFIVI